MKSETCEVKPEYDAICSSCGSNDIAFDAFSAWDATTQKFELVTTMDGGHCCNNCGLDDITVDWVRI